MITAFVVALCVFIGVLSVIDLGADNPIEKEADVIINEELGTTNVNIAEIVTEAEKAKAVIDAPKADAVTPVTPVTSVTPQ